MNNDTDSGLRRLSCKAFVKAEGDSGELEAIVNAFGVVDRGGERTMPGCAAESLAKKLPRGVWMHRWDQPIAKTLEAREIPPGDESLPEDLRELGGLYVRAQFHKEIDDSWQAYLKLKHGYVDEFSIGYALQKSAWDEENEVLELHKIEWFEWSPVLVGMNQLTTTLSVKGGHVGLPLAAHADAVLDAVAALADRLEGLADLREADGQRLSEKHGDTLRDLKGRIEALEGRARRRVPAGQLDFLAITGKAIKRKARQ